MTNANIRRANLLGEIVERMNEHYECNDDYRLYMSMDFTNHADDEVIATAVVEKHQNHSNASIRFKGIHPDHTETIEEISKYIHKHVRIYKEES